MWILRLCLKRTSAVTGLLFVVCFAAIFHYGSEKAHPRLVLKQKPTQSNQISIQASPSNPSLRHIGKYGSEIRQQLMVPQHRPPSQSNLNSILSSPRNQSLRHIENNGLEIRHQPMVSQDRPPSQSNQSSILSSPSNQSFRHIENNGSEIRHQPMVPQDRPPYQSNQSSILSSPSNQSLRHFENNGSEIRHQPMIPQDRPPSQSNQSSILSSTSNQSLRHIENNGSEIRHQSMEPQHRPPSQSNQSSILSSQRDNTLRGIEQSTASVVTKYSSFKDALVEKANGEREIILIPTDMAFASMALNFYVTSLANNNISNYLFVGFEAKVCVFLNSQGVDCYAHFNEMMGKQASTFGTVDFNHKNYLKFKIILDSLLLNYTVLMADADIVFFKNPFEYFHCLDCDMYFQNDGPSKCGGFYLSQPTQPCIDLHINAWNLSQQTSPERHQTILNIVTDHMINEKKIKIHILREDIFPNGNVYFETGKRMFLGDNPCKDCVIVHNNWIASYDAKELRFKENGLWGVDIDGYYGNPDTRYLLYREGKDFANKSTLARELNALRNAFSIGYLLNRTVILPSFTCYRCQYSACKASHGRCSFHTHYRVTTFNKHFYGKYREHVFLQHQKVPESVKQSVSPVYTIKCSQFDSSNATSENEKIFTPKNDTEGASASDIVSWFGSLKYSVLQFSSLEGIFGGFPESDRQFEEINKKLGNAFAASNYRQL